jgi:hypothetical protein
MLAAQVPFADLKNWFDYFSELLCRGFRRKQLASLQHGSQYSTVINNICDQCPAAQSKHRAMHASQKGYDAWFRKLARSVRAQAVAQPFPGGISCFPVKPKAWRTQFDGAADGEYAPPLLKQIGKDECDRSKVETPSFIRPASADVAKALDSMWKWEISVNIKKRVDQPTRLPRKGRRDGAEVTRDLRFS